MTMKNFKVFFYFADTNDYNITVVKIFHVETTDERNAFRLTGSDLDVYQTDNLHLAYLGKLCKEISTTSFFALQSVISNGLLCLMPNKEYQLKTHDEYSSNEEWFGSIVKFKTYAEAYDWAGENDMTALLPIDIEYIIK